MTNLIKKFVGEIFVDFCKPRNPRNFWATKIFRYTVIIGYKNKKKKLGMSSLPENDLNVHLKQKKNVNYVKKILL